MNTLFDQAEGLRRLKRRLERATPLAWTRVVGDTGAKSALSNISVFLARRGMKTLVLPLAHEGFWRTALERNPYLSPPMRPMRGPGGVDLMPRPYALDPKLPSDSKELRQIWEGSHRLGNTYNTVFVETGNASSKRSRQLLEGARRIVLNITPEPEAVLGALRLKRLIDEENPGERHWLLLVHRAANQDEAQRAYDALREGFAETISWLGWLPEDSRISNPRPDGVPFCLLHPNSETTWRFDQAAAALAQNCVEDMEIWP